MSFSDEMHELNLSTILSRFSRHFDNLADHARQVENAVADGGTLRGDTNIAVQRIQHLDYLCQVLEDMSRLTRSLSQLQGLGHIEDGQAKHLRANLHLEVSRGLLSQQTDEAQTSGKAQDAGHVDLF